MSVFTPLLVMCNMYLNCMIAIPPEEIRSFSTYNECMAHHKVAFPQFINTREKLEAFKEIPWANFVCHESEKPIADDELREFSKLAMEKYGMPKGAALPIKAF